MCRTLLFFSAGILAACGSVQSTESAVVQQAPSPETEPAASRCPARIFQGDYEVTDETSLQGLSEYTIVDGSISIDGTTLTNVGRLGCLQEIYEDLTITENASLVDLDGLSALTSIGRLFVENNASLADLDGLSALDTVYGYIHIENNDALMNLEGLSAVTSVDSLSICDNDSLTSLDGLLSATTSLGGGLNIQNNSSLTNLDALNSITSIGGEMLIFNNASLTTLNGLSAVTSVTGSMTISQNASLTNLDGLNSITSVGVTHEHGGGSSLRINYNSTLTNIDGLSAITYMGVRLYILDNPALPTCAARALEAQLRTQRWTGVTSISGNNDTVTCR